MIIYFWNKCQKMSDQLITVLNEAEYCLTEHMLNITYYYLHEILICIFLTFSYFWAFTLVSIKKIVSFTFLRYFNLKVECRGMLSIFLFLLVWSWSVPYLTILSLPLSLLKISGSARGFVFKKKPLKKVSSK